MLRRFKVIADYPKRKLKIGDILIQYYVEKSYEKIYTYVTNWASPLQGKKCNPKLVENNSRIFQEMDKIERWQAYYLYPKNQ